MERTTFIEHKGRQIVFVNLADASLEEIASYIEEAKRIIAEQPPKSVFCLTDVTNASFSKSIMRDIKAYVAHNEPYIWRSAIVGVEGIVGVVFAGVVKFSGRQNLVLKKTLDEAKDWLSREPLPD